MEHHVGIPYLREIIVFLIAAGVMVPLFHRMRISPVLGYLVVGGAIGPFGLGLWAGDFPALHWVVIDDLAGVQALAELGVIFLLFVIGLELSLERLWAMRRLVFGLGSAQILITGAIIGVIAWEFGNSIPASIVLGACLSLSSTAIVMQLLMQRRRLGTPLGRSSFSILLMQDLAVVPILFVVGVLGAKVEGNLGLDLALALGAFLAGLLLAETEYRHTVEVDIEPFKGLMLGLFFMSVGMGIDWRVIAQEPAWILASVLGLFALKSLVTAALCLAFGLGRSTAVETGLLLGQGGEFAFIVVGLAMSLTLIPPDVGQFMLIVAGLTMLVTPLVATAAERLATLLETGAVEDPEHAVETMGAVEGHVILAGFGRVGRTLVETLQAEAIPFVAIDADAAGVAAARKEGLPVFYGDASRLEMLERAHIERASAVVLTMDSPQAAEAIARAVRRAWPIIPIYARARDRAHAGRLIEAGATLAVPEAFEASLQLAGRVLEGFGIDEDVVRRRLDQQRSLENLQAVSADGVGRGAGLS